MTRDSFIHTWMVIYTSQQLIYNIYKYMSRESRREKCEKAAPFFIRNIQDDRVQTSGVHWPYLICLCGSIKPEIPKYSYAYIFSIPGILICSRVLQENQERKESIFGCQNRSWDMHTHTYIHILNWFHTSHTSWREKIVTPSERNLNSWQINTGWWIKVSK